MRNLKRFLALALTMLMVIGSFSLSAKSFPDTAEMTADQINALDILSDLSIFLGKEDGTFGGAEEINRKEMAILASRIQTGEKFGTSYGENVTPFADVVSDFEAILYASNMGIVIGDENGNFNPDAKVMYQDVLTMIVRTLGYKGAAMDAGYPSTYILKAKELGITNGVSSLSTTSWTANVQRQQVAELLYNALFAVKADGTTAAKMFGIDTYVLTAMKDYNITGVTCYDANGTRVVVQPLNADGSINDMYYHLPVSAFEEAGVEIVLGASYRIASEDNLATVKSISACPFVELADDADETAELYADGTVVLTGTDGKPVSYKAVTRYTQVYNNQGTHRADNEIIVYNQRGFNWTLGTNLVWMTDRLEPNENSAYIEGLLTDAHGNLLDANGFIVAYYMPELNDVETVYQPFYVYDDATDTYAPADWDYLLDVCAQAQALGTRYRMWTGDQAFMNDKGVVVANNSTFSITDKDDKYTAVAYDDNYDGKYDRLFFMYHTFGIGSGANGVNVNSGFNPAVNSTAAMSPYIADTAVAEGELVRFYADAARVPFNGAWQGLAHLTTAWATVVEKYETTTVSGLVTAVNGTKMTIGGKTYDIATMALHNFKEANPYGKQDPKSFIGQNVTAVLYDGGIFKVQGYTNTWVIFEDYTGLTTNGFVTALAFSESAELKNITIASVDGYFFLYNNYNIHTNTSNTNTISAIYDKLQTGYFYEATKDVYGYYHISTTGVTNNWAGKNWTKYADGAGWGAEKDFWFANNRSCSFSWLTGSYWTAEGYVGGGANHIWTPANAPTDWIFFDPTTKTFQTGKGFPADGSYIAATAVDTGCHFKATVNMFDCLYISGNVAYFSNAKFFGTFNANASSSTTATLMTDLVLIDAAAAADYTVDNLVPGITGAGETLYGFRYVYNKALSLSTGKQVSVATDGIYNYRLEPGVYAVVNNVIDRRIYRADDSNGLMACATLYSGANPSVGLGKMNGFGLQSSADYSDGSQDDAEIRIFENKSFTLYTWNCDGNLGSVFADFNGDGKIDKYSYVEDWAAVEFGDPSGTACRVWYVKGSEYTDTPVFFVVQNRHNGGSMSHWNGIGGK